MLNIIRTVKTEPTTLKENVTLHFKMDRKNRHEFIKSHMGYGNIVDIFLVDSGHKNGLELHAVTDTGIVKIYNRNTLRWVTMLIARPQQIKRYYRATNKQIPQNIVKIAYKHEMLGWNEI